ncbi:Pectinesterase 2 [Apostasia shenzhenica]|uniref:Pectinesterase 2 n=1 Tax=Apostasia shenzhenica TaxID=1088818 RepID=A0A2H9ZY45_9ASPA|nr:Pectinesterase 2 [Apostasia shenzhenica]
MRPATLLLLLFLLALTSSLLLPSAAISVPRGSPISFLPVPSSALKTSAKFSINGGLEALLKSFCKHTDYFDLCMSSIRKAAPQLRSFNTASIAAALMKAVDAKAHEAVAFAKKLANDPHFTGRTRELLHDCIDTYSDALDNLKSAGDAIRARDNGTRDSMLSAMISNFGTCEDGFQELSLKSPTAEWTETLQHMVDNVLAIVNKGRPNDY